MDFYNELKRLKKKLKLNNEQMGKVIDKNGDTFRKALNRQSFSKLEIEKLSEEFKIGQNSDITKGPIEDYGNSPAINSNKNGVPYYDVDFYGGFDFAFNDQTIQPAFMIDYAPYNDCDAWINVSGKSMSPFISHGDIAALKKLNTWQEFIPFGEIYAVLTEEHKTIKIVTAGKDEDHLTLVPYNKSREFVEQQIPKKLIHQMYRVKGSIKKFF